ncbi:hypothetical protein BDW66DRAFT_154944 [Aspergillus desertorum]
MAQMRWRRRTLQPLTGVLTLIPVLDRAPTVSAADPLSSTSSSSSSSPLLRTNSNSQAHPSRGSKAGIFIGATVGVLAIVAAIILFFCLRSRRRRRRSRSAPVPVLAPTPDLAMETNKGVVTDAVSRAPGPGSGDHNQNRAEADSQYQKSEAEVLEAERRAGISRIK